LSPRRAPQPAKPDPHRFDDLFAEFPQPILLRPFFGGEGLYVDDTMFGMVFSDTIYFKTNETTRKLFLVEKRKPFTFKKRSTGETVVTSWYAIPDRLYDDPQEFAEWARVAYDAVLASPTTERKRKNAATPKLHR
jgi:DNA transformation protein and related proteins